uniref:Uncharacterized protein n=1 Tax=viral metagenome TaxID=1070528 RepID=A0A6C0KEY4_9ZZZZ
MYDCALAVSLLAYYALAVVSWRAGRPRLSLLLACLCAYALRETAETTRGSTVGEWDLYSSNRSRGTNMPTVVSLNRMLALLPAALVCFAIAPGWSKSSFSPEAMRRWAVLHANGQLFVQRLPLLQSRAIVLSDHTRWNQDMFQNFFNVGDDPYFIVTNETATALAPLFHAEMIPRRRERRQRFPEAKRRIRERLLSHERMRMIIYAAGNAMGSSRRRNSSFPFLLAFAYAVPLIATFTVGDPYDTRHGKALPFAVLGRAVIRPRGGENRATGVFQRSRAIRWPEPLRDHEDFDAYSERWARRAAELAQAVMEDKQLATEWLWTVAQALRVRADRPWDLGLPYELSARGIDGIANWAAELLADAVTYRLQAGEKYQ